MIPFALAPLLLAVTLATTAPAAAPHATHTRAPLRVLCLGGSYTAGVGVSKAECWPALLAAQLDARGWECARPKVVAGQAWSSGELLQAVDGIDPDAKYDLVTLEVGANDQYRGRTLDVFEGVFNVLLSRAVELAGNDPRRVVVLTLPDWGVTPYGYAREPEPERISNGIDRYDSALLERTALVGARTVDVTRITRRHGADPRWLASDGLHPSAAAHREWAGAIADTLRDLVPSAQR